MIPDSVTLTHIQQWVGAEASPMVVVKLQKYVDLVLATNAQHNLIGPKEADQIWQRHILDSAQLYLLVQALHPRLVMDIGSGAGFPGIVLSIMGLEKMILVESIQKKARFLQEVIDTLDLAAEVRCERLENLKSLKPEVITARAMSALENILTWSWHLCSPNTKFLLLKGEKVQEEIATAQKHWAFEYTLSPSITSATGQLLEIWKLRKK